LCSVESRQKTERFSQWLVEKVRCACLHSPREHAPGHHGWLLPQAAALGLPHTYPSPSHRQRTLSFWSRLSNQLKERSVSSMAVLRHEATMNWLGLVTMCGHSHCIVTASCFVPKSLRDQGCKSACQLPHIFRQASSWPLYRVCTAKLPCFLVQTLNDWINW
jgi:hypothetical protein